MNDDDDDDELCSYIVRMRDEKAQEARSARYCQLCGKQCKTFVVLGDFLIVCTTCEEKRKGS